MHGGMDGWLHSSCCLLGGCSFGPRLLCPPCCCPAQESFASRDTGAGHRARGMLCFLWQKAPKFVSLLLAQHLWPSRSGYLWNSRESSSPRCSRAGLLLREALAEQEGWDGRTDRHPAGAAEFPPGRRFDIVTERAEQPRDI